MFRSPLLPNLTSHWPKNILRTLWAILIIFLYCSTVFYITDLIERKKFEREKREMKRKIQRIEFPI